MTDHVCGLQGFGAYGDICHKCQEERILNPDQVEARLLNYFAEAKSLEVRLHVFENLVDKTVPDYEEILDTMRKTQTFYWSEHRRIVKALCAGEKVRYGPG